MKFNKLKYKWNRVLNHEGAEAFALDAKTELYTAVVASSLSKSFYENASSRLARIQTLVKELAAQDPEFVAKLAVYTRKKMHLRSLPLVLTVELAKRHSGDDLVRRTTRQVVQRADEITELLAYYQMANGREGTKRLNGLSKQLQKGLADAFNRFDAYQFAKYNRATEVKLRDALFLVHPKAKDEAQQTLFDKIANNQLETPYTWETQLSAVGQQKYTDEVEKADAFRKKWTELVRSGKLGYMALLRNLRNLLEADLGLEDLKAATDRIADPEQVRRSKQLPFRFLAAYRELSDVAHGKAPLVLKALEKAMEASVENLKGFDAETRVVIASDTSGSMLQPISKRSKVELIDIGLVLAMLLKSKCEDVVCGIFGTDYQIVQTPNHQVLSSVMRLRRTNVGWSTNGYKVIEDLIRRKVVVDKVMIFTDLQLWNSASYGDDAGKSISQSWEVYKHIAPQAKIYLFDLAGYGQSPLNVLRKDVFLIGGWSDKVFDVLAAIETGGKALAEIEEVVL
jgi:60 kDa SS-A/Ro ribonucleoprotein